MTKIKPINYSLPSSRISKSSFRSQSDFSRSESDFSRSYAEIINLINQLLPSSTSLVSDPLVSGKVDRVKSLYLTLGESEQTQVNNYLNKKNCQNTKSVPGTVGAVLCGCFMKSNAQPVGCLAGCASTPIGDVEKCKDTVLYWSMNGTSPKSEVLNRGTQTCRVNLSPNFPINSLTNDDRMKLLAQSNCTSATFFDGMTGEPLMQSQGLKTFPVPTSTISTTTPPQITKTPTTKTTNSGNSSFWWLFVVFFFLILVGIIIYIYMK